MWGKEREATLHAYKIVHVVLHIISYITGMPGFVSKDTTRILDETLNCVCKK